METQFAISARQLTKKYGDFTAVDRLDLEVARGEIFGLLGPNGAGKTTTILMLLGLSEPTSGRASVVGLDPAREPLKVKRRVGYLPDSVGFYADMTGAENLNYTARLNSLSATEAGDKVTESLEQVGLIDSRDDKVGTYSRGMRQRLGIADALVKDPDVLILDEPTISLDPQAVTETLELIRRLPKQRDVTVLLSSHMLHQMQAVCDRVAIFVAGRVVASGRLDELAAKMNSGQITIELQASGPDVKDAITSVGAVRTVNFVNDRWIITAEHDCRSELVRALVDRNIAVTQLDRPEADLDEIYRRYFAGEAS